jgi:hypothetical protein
MDWDGILLVGLGLALAAAALLVACEAPMTAGSEGTFANSYAPRLLPL